MHIKLSPAVLHRVQFRQSDFKNTFDVLITILTQLEACIKSHRMHSKIIHNKTLPLYVNQKLLQKTSNLFSVSLSFFVYIFFSWKAFSRYPLRKENLSLDLRKKCSPYSMYVQFEQWEITCVTCNICLKREITMLPIHFYCLLPAIASHYIAWLSQCV